MAIHAFMDWFARFECDSMAREAWWWLVVFAAMVFEGLTVDLVWHCVYYLPHGRVRDVVIKIVWLIGEVVGRVWLRSRWIG